MWPARNAWCAPGRPITRRHRNWRALTWVARGALAAKSLTRPTRSRGRKPVNGSRFLIGQKLDDDPWLPRRRRQHRGSCAGAGRARRTPRSRRHPRASSNNSPAPPARANPKSINLLGLEGKPAPPLDAVPPSGSAPNRPHCCAARHPVLLFFWALVQRLQSGGRHHCQPQRTFAARAVVIGPSRLYGYVAGGEDAPPAKGSCTSGGSPPVLCGTTR